jgi:hypothetical protein
MSIYNKMMNDFGAKNAPNVQDASLNYAKARGLILYIGHFTNKNFQSGRIVSFKGFLDTFKLAFSFEVESQDAFFQDGPDLYPQSTRIEYQFTLQVPSTSKEEGILNIGRFEEFNRMVRSKSISSKEPNYLLVSLSNLIQNGQYDKKKTINNFASLKQVAALVHVDNTNMSIDTELGFWETQGGLIPKVFSINFQLHFIPDWKKESFTPATNIKDENGDTKSIKYPHPVKYFKPNGGYNTHDVEQWPWGVTHSGMNWKNE